MAGTDIRIYIAAGTVQPSWPEFEFYQKKSAIRAKVMREAFSVETPHGVATGRLGDYLIYDRGGLWPVPKDVFEEHHALLDTQEGEML